MKLNKIASICGALTLVFFIALSQAEGDRLYNAILDVLNFKASIAQYYGILFIGYIGMTVAALLIYFLPALVRKIYAAIKKVNYSFLPSITASILLLSMFLIPVVYEFTFQAIRLESVANTWSEFCLRFREIHFETYVYYLAAAFCEELVFRYLIITRLCKEMPAIAAVVLSAFAFGLVHYYTTPGADWFSISVDGLLFGMVFLIGNEIALNNRWQLNRAFALILSTLLHFGMNVTKILIDGSEEDLIPLPSKLSLIFDQYRYLLSNVDDYLQYSLAIRILVFILLSIYYVRAVKRRLKSTI